MNDYRFALRAYPTAYRDDHGAELVDIANESAEGRWSLKQSSSLVAGGLRTRAREGTHNSSRGVWASGARIGLLVWMVMGAAPGLAYAVGLSSAPTYQVSRLVLMLPLVPIGALMISTRWWVATLITGAWGWAWVLLVFFNGPIAPGVLVVGPGITAVLVIGLAWWLALATDGHRVASPLVVGALMVCATVLVGIHPGGFVAAFGVAISVLVLGGLILSRSDPRGAAAGTVYSLFIFTSIFPIAVTNDAVGWQYWGPITILVLVLSVMLAASWSGIRRLVGV